MIQIDSSSLLTSVTPASNVDAQGVVNLICRANPVEGAAPTCWPMVARLTGVLGLAPKMRVFFPAPSFWMAHWTAADKGYFSYDRINWTQMANPVVFGAGYSEISHNAPFMQNEVWVARDRVEGVYSVTAWINTLNPALVRPLAGATGWVVDTYSPQTDERGRVVPSQPLLGFMISDPSFPGPKRVAAIISGIHAAEHWGTTGARYFVEWLCGATAEARLLRSMFDVVVLPLTNPIGREGGHTRAQWQLGPNGANDLNRNWDKNPAPFETVAKVRGALLRLVPPGMPWFMDFHASMNTQGAANLWWMGSTGEPTNAPLNNEFGSRLSARMTGNGGATKGDTIYPNDQMWGDSWAAHVLGAQLAQTIECNSGNPTPLSVAQANAAGLGLALWDLAVAGRFGAVVPPPVAQTITAFSVVPTTIQAGQLAVVSWATQNATAVTLNGAVVAFSGSMSVSPAASTTYTLVASGPAPNVSQSVSLSVTPVQAGQTINSFTATPVSVNAGQTSTLAWTTSNASVVTLNGATVAANGSQVITPNAGVVYTLRATGAAPDVTRALTWNPPPVVLTAT